MPVPPYPHRILLCLRGGAVDDGHRTCCAWIGRFALTPITACTSGPLGVEGTVGALTSFPGRHVFAVVHQMPRRANGVPYLDCPGDRNVGSSRRSRRLRWWRFGFAARAWHCFAISLCSFQVSIHQCFPALSDRGASRRSVCGATQGLAFGFR